jgi:hypothetical protein
VRNADNLTTCMCRLSSYQEPEPAGTVYRDSFNLYIELYLTECLLDTYSSQIPIVRIANYEVPSYIIFSSFFPLDPYTIPAFSPVRILL